MTCDSCCIPPSGETRRPAGLGCWCEAAESDPGHYRSRRPPKADPASHAHRRQVSPGSIHTHYTHFASIRVATTHNTRSRHHAGTAVSEEVTPCVGHLRQCRVGTLKDRVFLFQLLVITDQNYTRLYTMLYSSDYTVIVFEDWPDRAAVLSFASMDAGSTAVRSEVLL